MNEGWIAYNKSWEEFCAADLNQPGTQIDVRDFVDLNVCHVHTIGDINKLGGVCDCCPEVLGKQTIRRYRVLVASWREST